MDKFWERYITSRPAPGESKGAFDAFAAAHRDPGPRTMAQEPRIGLQGGQLVQNTADGSRPGYNGPLVGSKKGIFTSEAMDNVSDAILKAYAKDDISLLFEKSKVNPTGLISAKDAKQGIFSKINIDQDRLNTIVKKGATIGANSTIVCGNNIGSYAFIGAGSVVISDIPNYALVVGNPSRQIGWVSEYGHKLEFDKEGYGFCKETNQKYRLLKNIVERIK